MTAPLARVDDVIEHGQPIPANVRVLRDEDCDYARRDDHGTWARRYGHDGQWYDEQLSVDLIRDWASHPLTVVEVDPDPEPQPAERHSLGDRVQCFITEPHGLHYWEARTNGRWCPGLAIDPEPDEVHYVISEFGPSDATLCGIGIEEDGNLSTTSEAEKGTCRDCRIALGEEPAELRRDRLIAELLDITGVDQAIHLRAAVRNLVNGHRAAESGPLVLSLPQVPDGAVALIGAATGTRYVPHAIAGSWVGGHEGTFYAGAFHGILGREGSVTVEFAPPREPRVWPAIDPMPEGDDLPIALDVKSRSGAGVTRWTLVTDDGLYTGPLGGRRTLAELRCLGDVTEVLPS